MPVRPYLFNKNQIFQTYKKVERNCQEQASIAHLTWEAKHLDIDEDS